MSVTIKIRRDTAANWSSNNPTLHSGELGLDTTNYRLKAGDGTTTWTALNFLDKALEDRIAALELSVDYTHGGLGIITTEDNDFLVDETGATAAESNPLVLELFTGTLYLLKQDGGALYLDGYETDTIQISLED